MRDPARIPVILDLLKQAWEIDEDMRFMQLIFNLQANYSHKNNNVGLVERIEKDGFSTPIMLDLSSNYHQINSINCPLINLSPLINLQFKRVST